MKMRIRCSGTRRNHMSTRRLPLRSRTTTKTLGTSWRWDAASRRSCSTTSHGYTTTNLSTQQLSLRRRVCIETGRYQKYRLTFQKTFNPKFMYGVRTRTRVNVKDCRRVLIRHGLFAYCSSMSKHLERRRRCFNIWNTLYATRLSYLRSMKAQLLKTPRPSGLKLWLSLVRVQRTNASLPDRPLRNRLWICMHSVDSWTRTCWDSTATIRSKDGTLLQGLSAWVRTAFSRLWATVT